MSFNIYIIFSFHDFVLQIIYQTGHKKKRKVGWGVGVQKKKKNEIIK